jgi:hypothetical protein
MHAYLSPQLSLETLLLAPQLIAKRREEAGKVAPQYATNYV